MNDEERSEQVRARLRAHADAAVVTAPDEALARWRDTRAAGPVAGRAPGRGLAAVAAVFVLVAGGVVTWLAATHRDASPPAEPPPTTTASPFRVDRVPAGYGLASAGRGDQPLSWGSDIEPPIEGFTLLSPDGSIGPDVVAVGYGLGPEDEWDQEYNVRRGATSSGRITVDGRTAYHWQGRGWSELLVRRRDALWVRVSSSTRRPLAELTALARAVPDTTDHDRAPRLPEAVAGLRRVGSVDATVLVALDPGYDPQAAVGPPGSYGVYWEGPDPDSRLSVRTLPGTAATGGVLVHHPWMDPRPKDTATVTVDGRPAIHRERCFDGMGCARNVVTTTAWGDTLVVAARGPAVPSFAELDAVAASARRLDAPAWQRLRVEAFGGPGLHPDAGRRELARGRTGGVDWLVQSADRPRDQEPLTLEATVEQAGIDPCLKFGDLTRVCAAGQEGGGRDGSRYAIGPLVPADGTVRRGLVTLVVLDGYPAAAVTIHVVGPAVAATAIGPGYPALDETVPLRPVPGSSARFAVVPGDIGMATCPGPGGMPPGLSPDFHYGRLALLDAAGTEIGCVGIG